MTAARVAETLAQMGGGGRLRAMIGAKHFVHHADGTLAFKFMKARQGANYVEITLTPKDLYTMRIGRIRRGGIGFEEIVVAEDLFFDQLIPTFENATGLYLTL